MRTSAGPRAESRLAHVILARDPKGVGQSGQQVPMVFAHREALIFTLGKAAALEHLVMCQYLYAAFSLKEREDEGLGTEQLALVRPRPRAP
jgi:hypothetical protein